MKRMLIAVCIASLAFTLLETIAPAADLSIGTYTLVSQKRITRTVWEIVYKADVTNSSRNAAYDVTATVTSNSSHTTIVEGALSFGDAPWGIAVTSKDTFTIRHDRAYPFDANALVWTISSQPTGSTSLWVGPPGGKLVFPNGVILEIPEGALDKDTLIEIADPPVEQIMLMITSQPFRTHEMRYLGGFQAKPDGLTFNVPITATFPVAKLEPHEVPLLIEPDLSTGTFRLWETAWTYKGEKGTITAKFQHFSPPTAVGAKGYTGDSLESCELLRAEYGNEIADNCIQFVRERNECRHCTGFNESFCENVDPIMPACCEILAAERSKCYPGCSCCKEEEAEVSATEYDYANKTGCQIAVATVQAIFKKCDGQPKEFKRFAEDSCKVITTIYDAPPVAYTCQDNINIRAKLVDTGGNELPLPVMWASIDKDKADAIATGDRTAQVTTKNPGQATIKAIPPGPNSPPGEAIIQVLPRKLMIVAPGSVPSSTVDMKVCDDLTLTAVCDPSGCPGTVQWEILSQSPPGVIELDGDSSGTATQWTAKKQGTAIIWAFTYDCMHNLMIDHITINVAAPTGKLQISLKDSTIAMGDKTTATAKVLPDCVSCDVTWSSDNPAVSVSPAEGASPSTAQLEGKLPGTAHITATTVGYFNPPLSQTVEVTVTKPELVLSAKIGDCDWNASYCAISTLGEPVPLTVRAGIRTSSGGTKYIAGIDIGNYAVGGDYQGYGERIDPISGQTNAAGIYQAQISNISWWVKARVQAAYYGAFTEVQIAAINTGPLSTMSHDAYALDPYVSGATYKSGSASMDASAQVDYVNTTGSIQSSAECKNRTTGIASIAFDGGWYDYIMIIPRDLSRLGEPVAYYKLGFRSSVSGQAHQYPSDGLPSYADVGAGSGNGNNETILLASYCSRNIGGFCDADPTSNDSVMYENYVGFTALGMPTLIGARFTASSISAAGGYSRYEDNPNMPGYKYWVDYCDSNSSSSLSFSITTQGISEVGLGASVLSPEDYFIVSASGTNYSQSR